MKIDKIMKKIKCGLISGIVLVLISIFFYCTAVIITEKENDVIPVVWSELRNSENDKELSYVKISNILEPDQFAEVEGDEYNCKYYILGDETNMYIARLKEETFNKIENQLKEQGEEFVCEIKGYTYSVPDEVKKIAIERINDYSDSDFTIADFEHFFGKYYLDEVKTPNSGVISLCVCIGIFSDILGISFIISYFVKKSRAKKIFKVYNKNELEEILENGEVYEKAKVYLAEKYLISTVLGLDIINYDDLYWIYINKTKFRGVTTGRYVIAIKKDKKSLQIAYALRDEKMLQEIIEKIHEKNNQILIGYTADNQKAYAEFRKNK